MQRKIANVETLDDGGGTKFSVSSCLSFKRKDGFVSE